MPDVSVDSLPALPPRAARDTIASPGSALGLDDALQWHGLEARLAPVLGRHALVALYQRSAELSTLDEPRHRARAFFQLLTELLGEPLVRRLLPDSASRD